MRTAPALLLPVVFLACTPSSSTTDGGPDAGPVNTCPAPSGAGTTHGDSVSADETWMAAESPHIVPYDLSIYAKLTLEPCAIVRIAAKKTVTVNANGSIEANGAPSRPVVIEPSDAGQAWASIRLIGGTARLSSTIVKGGGAPLNIVPDFQAALDVRSGNAQSIAPDPVLYVNDVRIERSETQGVYAHDRGAFTPDSQGLTITGSKGHAVTIAPNLVETLPSGSYTGNAIDDIMLPDALPGQIGWDVVMHDRGVPYYSGGTNQFGVTSVAALTGTAVLTIEPGVRWKFMKGTGVLNVDPGGTPSRGVLVAEGTSDKHIVFTSNEPKATAAAGDWLGIRMGGDDPRNHLDYVDIEYAGKLQGASGSNSCHSLQDGQTHNGGALRVYHLPRATLVENTTFLDSETNGVDRGWRDDEKPTFLGGGNTFTNIGRCSETLPRDTDGACPQAPLPCP